MKQNRSVRKGNYIGLSCPEGRHTKQFNHKWTFCHHFCHQTHILSSTDILKNVGNQTVLLPLIFHFLDKYTETFQNIAFVFSSKY